VDGSGNDRVDVTGEREASGSLDVLSGRATRFEIARRLAFPTPALFPAADDAHIRIERLAQRFAHDFGADPARIAHGHGQARPSRRRSHD